ncbi:MAG: formate-dependent phosphoribosylglycinamide formyltransferase (GAR transformylase) [Chlamydiales bacterium]|jgi:formate-dependent phosphoribosylglycinamide formyltransferase (GAR transformylase)
MHVILVEPAFPRNQREFARALHAVGARVTGIGEAPLESLDGELRGWLHGYEQVPSVTHQASLLDAVRRIQGREWVDRIEATVEAHIMPVAHVREATEIPGTSTRTAFLCRDKPAMKEALREAGVPCAQSTGASSLEEVRDFAERVGFPLILKPRDAAGAAGTYRADDSESLESIMLEVGLDRGAPTAVEEFIEGHEGFYDTLCIDGEVVHDFVCHYHPGVLEAMRTRWISPQIICSNRVESSVYDEVKELGQRVVKELGIGTSATHMEWFFGPKGLKFSEIGCRPPGVRVWDLYGAGNDLDLYEEWAKAVALGSTDAKASRACATGMIALRPDCDGHIESYEGVEQIEQRFGRWILDKHFPPIGSPTQPAEAGYMANAWMRLRHRDDDELRSMLDQIGETIKVHAS